MRDDYLMHYGVSIEDGAPGRGSGRYAKGSGENPYQHAIDLYSLYNKYKHDGLTQRQIAEQLGIFNRQGKPDVDKLRAKYSNAKNAKRAHDVEVAQKLMEECDGNRSAVARRMGLNESTVRSLLDEKKAQNSSLAQRTADTLQDYVDRNRYIDISSGTEYQLGVSQTRMKNAIALLEEKGYLKHQIQIDQMGTNHKTTITVLTPPGVSYGEVSEHRYDIRYPGQETKLLDSKGDVKKVNALSAEVHPVSVSSDRIKVVYAEQGGTERDGLIQLRRGVDDISLGAHNYAQVRIAVDGTHYLKGMAVYSDDMPPGVDIIFNTNKHEGTAKLDTFKKMEKNKDGTIDWENPFGATVTYKEYTDATGKVHQGAINVVRAEGEWQKWDKNLASQFLSKQPVAMAERQLGYSYQDRKVEFDEIRSLENPAVKKKLLMTFADNCDSAAVELKAAPFAQQQTYVILPFPELGDGECYAPRYANGTKLALVRYPHGGTFEIPTVTVNNDRSPAKKVLGNAPDAIGINANVAGILSGADFDGDTVVAIPLSDKVKVRTSDPLPELKGFDPKEAYPKYKGMKVISAQAKQTEMGKVTNLITDMTLKGASREEIAMAVKHSMVIIDAEKHELNYKQSEIDNHIAELKKRWQDTGDGKTGAGTIISRASSEKDVPETKDWYPSSKTIDAEGRKITEPTNNIYKDVKLKYRPVELKEDKKTGQTYYLDYDEASGKRKRVYATEEDVERVNKKYEGISFDSNGRVKVNEDTRTGELYYLRTDPSSNKKVRVPITDQDIVPGSLKEHVRLQSSTKMAEETDAFKLTSGGSKENPGYRIEKIYATYANNMKDLANAARREWLKTGNLEYNKDAAKQYADEVASLDRKLNDAKAHSPVERQAQLMANRRMAERKRDNPDMTKEEIKKYKGREIINARNKLGGKKPSIEITDNEWKAIQSGAISNNKLNDILDHADLDKLRKLATPRATKTITPSMKSLAKSMDSAGYTLKEIADRLGVSTSSVYEMTSG